MQSSGPVAQGIEHRIPNPGVAGSNPAGITIYIGYSLLKLRTLVGICYCPKDTSTKLLISRRLYLSSGTTINVS